MKKKVHAQADVSPSAAQRVKRTLEELLEDAAAHPDGLPPSDIDPYVQEIGEALKVFDENGVIKDDWEWYKILKVEDCLIVLHDTMKSAIKPYEAAAVFLGAYIDCSREKIALQDKVFKKLIENYDFGSEEYSKSTFSIGKLEMRLEAAIPEYYDLKKQLDEIGALMNCLNECIVFVRMVERSSWGRKRVNEE